MPSGTLQVYTALAENAAPLPGVTVLVRNEAGTQIARLTTNDVGSAPELVLTAPDEAYSLDEANTTVRPYAVDVSGGVEAGKGIKDAAKIRAFMQAVGRV